MEIKTGFLTYFAKNVFITTAILVALNSCTVVLRDCIDDHHEQAYITFLNIFPIQIGVSCVAATLILFFAVKIRSSLLNSRQMSKRRAGQRHLLALLLTMVCVQLMKLMLAISSLVYSSIVIKLHHKCLENELVYAVVYDCASETAVKMSYTQYFQPGYWGLLDFSFLGFQMYLARKEKRVMNAEEDGDQDAESTSNQMIGSDTNQLTRSGENQIAMSNASEMAESDVNQIAEPDSEQMTRSDESQIVILDANKIAVTDANQITESDASEITESDATKITESDANQIAESNKSNKIAQSDANQNAESDANQIAMSDSKKIGESDANQTAVRSK